MRHAPALPLLGVLCALLACGCSYSMHEYQAAGYAAPTAAGAPRKAEWIHASASQGVILGITDNTSYVDLAYARLIAQCPGDITGVGFAVGYDSPSQFSREYRRMYGVPPSRHALALREAAVPRSS